MTVTSRFSAWVRKNKLTALLIVALLVIIGVLYSSSSEKTPTATTELGGVESAVGTATTETPVTTSSAASEEKVVIEESTLSLVVSDVHKATDGIVSYAKNAGGFMVSSELTSPEESPTATVVVRVPAKKLQTAIEYYRALAVKVSSESITGTDVTKEYEDLNAQIAALETTIKQFEVIKAKATKISDLVSITEQIITLREEIDSLKGEKKFIAESAAFSKITVYLATDEFALPYQPSGGFRIGVVFKEAVRSLVDVLYGLGKDLIWVGVYGVLWIPALAVTLFLIRKRRKTH